MGQIATQLQGYRMPLQAQVGAVDVQEAVSRGVSNVQGIGFTVLLGFMFMAFSRIFDLYLTKFHIPGFAERLMAFVVIVSGSFWRPFQTKIGKRLLWLTAWMVLGLPFSVWRTDSLHLLTTQWWNSLVLFASVAGLTVDFRQYRRSVMTLAVAILALSLFCLHFGTMFSGRLFMANNSRFSNPNEMAQAMLIGIPFWLAIAKRSSSLLKKLLATSVLLIMVYIIAKTGSRGALISFVALYLVLLYHASAIGKAGLLLVGSLSLCAAVAFLPSALKDRYKTIFSDDRPEVQEAGEERLLVSAEGSTESREHLLRQSLILTATHPIFGVGVSQFSVAENSLAISQGLRKGSWLGTHNTYMQVACETGIPGAFFFISIMLLCLRKTHALYTATRDKLDLRDISTQAEALFLALVCLAITDVSIHAAYTMLLPVLAGMTIALDHTARPLLAAIERRKNEAPAPAPTMRRQVFPGRAPATAAAGYSGA
jgi:O-antigen ligase